jgi:hypothetical protein
VGVTDAEGLTILCIPEEQAMAEWTWGIALDEAYRIACEAAGAELDRHDPRFSSGQPWVGFRRPTGAGPALSYWVDTDTGLFRLVEPQYCGWTDAEFDGDRILAIASDAAEQFMPEPFRDLRWEWYVERRSDGAHVWGQVRTDTPAPVQPTPMCGVSIDRSSHVVESYSQHLIFDRLDAEPEITYDEALGIAEEAAGIGRLIFSREPALAWALSPDTSYLWHGPESMFYHIAFTHPRPGHVDVDALTGEVRNLWLLPEPEGELGEQPGTTDTDPPGMNE